MAVLTAWVEGNRSLFLFNTLSNGLAAPQTALSPIGILGDLIPSRVRELAKGGAVAVEHCSPDEQELQILHDSGIRKIVFHYRDIRQSTLSFVHHSASDEIKSSRRDLEEWRGELKTDATAFERQYLGKMARWLGFLEKWLQLVERHSARNPDEPRLALDVSGEDAVLEYERDDPVEVLIVGAPIPAGYFFDRRETRRPIGILRENRQYFSVEELLDR